MTNMKLIRLDARSPKVWIERYAINPLNNKKVHLLQWQKDLINGMYTPTGVLKKPSWFGFGAKKTGKSALATMLTAYRMFNSQRELYVAMASSEEQAFIIYRSFIELFSTAPWFKELKILKNSIIHKKNCSELKVLTSAVSSTHGLRPSILIADEIMGFDDKNFRQLSVLEASMTLSTRPQKFFLSNVPLHSDHQSLELLKYCKKDRNWQVSIFKASKPDQWKNKDQWAEANPMYRQWPQVRNNYNQDFERALNDKRAEVDFKRYNLGLGTSLDSNRWMDPENLQWVSNETEREQIFNDQSIRWACGWDLSLRGSDSTSWVFAGWHPEEGHLEDRKLYLFGRIYYGNIKNKKNLIQDKIKNWNLSGQVVWQGQVECVELEPILDDFYQLINKYPHIKDDLLNVFDPAFSMPYRKELHSKGFVSKTRTYSPKFMTNPIRRLQRMAELKSIHILENPNEAIKWQAGNGVVNELSRNWCMLNRLNKSPQLNVDYWSATLLALSELLIPKREYVIGVF